MLEQRRILVTGATGFIGKPLTLELLKAGYAVHALVRNPGKAADLSHPDLTLFEGDLDRPESVRAAMEGCTQVYHLAAFAQAWSADGSVFDRINFAAGRSLLEAALQSGVERVVITSTGGVFGPSTGGKPNDETAVAQPSFMTAYERSKAKLEAVVPDFVHRGLEVVIVNPTRVFGPGPLIDANGETLVMQRYLKGSFRFLPGDGSSTGSYAYIDDVVRGHMLAMDHGRPGQRYLLGGENASFRTFFDTIGRLSGRRYSMYGVPTGALMLFAKTQLLLAGSFGIRPLITPELVRKYTQNWDFSVEKAKNELGYTHRSLEDSVRDTLAWMEQSGLA